MFFGRGGLNAGALRFGAVLDVDGAILKAEVGVAIDEIDVIVLRRELCQRVGQSIVYEVSR